MKGYARIWRRIWLDEKFRSLPAHPGQFVVLYLLSAASNRVGIFTVSTGDLAERLDLRPSDSAALVAEVCSVMGWPWDGATRTVWIRSWWRWNPPESPSALVGYLRDLRDVPESPVRKSYIRTRPELPDTLLTAWRQGVGEPADSLPAGSRARAHVGPEPEPEHEPETESRDLSDQPAKDQSPEQGSGEGGLLAASRSREEPQPADPETWLPHLTVAQVQLEFPSQDVALTASKLRAKHGEAPFRKPSLEILRAWVKQAVKRGTEGREHPAQTEAREQRNRATLETLDRDRQAAEAARSADPLAASRMVNAIATKLSMPDSTRAP